MGNRKALAEIARLGLPPGQREKNLQDLGLWIAPEDLREVRALLAVGGADWSRSYPPSAAIASKASAVLVGCFAGLLRVACKPH